MLSVLYPDRVCLSVNVGHYIYPHLKTICFPFFPFLATLSSSSLAASGIGVEVPLPPAQALAAGLPELTLMIPRPVYPGENTVLVGFFAAGKAGNRSALLTFVLGLALMAGEARAELEGVIAGERAAEPGAGRAASQLGVGAGAALPRPGIDGPPLRGGRDGKGLLDDAAGEPLAVPHEACRPTADCELLAVELFSLSTRDAPTPLPRTPAAVVFAPDGPGKVG